jgi:hypothetical protein
VIRPRRDPGEAFRFELLAVRLGIFDHDQYYHLDFNSFTESQRNYNLTVTLERDFHCGMGYPWSTAQKRFSRVTVFVHVCHGILCSIGYPEHATEARD